MPKPEGDLVVVRSSFFAGSKLVRAGDVWAADDPVVTHYPAAFKPLVIQSSKAAETRETPGSPSRPPATPQRRVSLARARS